MLADSSGQRDEREKSINNKDIEIFLIFISFINLKKVNIEIAGDNGVGTFLSYISQYWTDFFRKSINSGVVIVTFRGPIYVANSEFAFQTFTLDFYK